MRSLGIKGVVRGKRVVTTNPDTSLPCPDDKVNRLFKASRPNKHTGFGLHLCADLVGDSLRSLLRTAGRGPA